MNRFTAGILGAIAAVLLTMPAGAQKKTEADAMFEAARQKETLEGDLSGAIKQYAAIVAKYKSNRAVTATALVRMAEAYQKMGNTEARKIYEQVVREYGDQNEAVTVARARLGKPEGATRQTSTLVWSGPKADPESGISPDGRYLSFTDWETGNLALHEIATGVDRRITSKGTWKDSDDFAEQSAISRDGKQVAYGWLNAANGRRYEIHLASLSGDPKPRRLYANPDIDWIAPYDWSPDGKWIAVQFSRKDRTAQIALISVTDGALRVLKSIDWRGTGRILFSPDGKYLGYDLPESDTSRQRDVFVLAVDGTREIPAVVRRGDDTMMGWSPDGKQLLFTSDRTGSPGLWGLRFAEGKPQGAPEMLKADIGSAIPLGLTRSGAFYYASFSGATNGPEDSTIRLTSFDFVSGKFLSAAKDVPQESFESIFSQNWSRDGKYLSYLSQRGRARASNLVLVIRLADTGQLVRELPMKLDYAWTFGWMPDGRSLLASGTDFKGRRGVYQIDVQTGEASLLAPMEQNNPQPLPNLAADGKSLFYRLRLQDGKQFAFIRRDLTSGSEKELIRRDFLGGINVSPDGQYIVTPSTDPSTKRSIMLLIPISGDEPRELVRVATDKLAFRGITWAPDSRSFLVLKGSNEKIQQNEEIWQVPVGGEAPRQLDLGPGGIPGQFSVHPDGKRIAYGITEGSRNPPRRTEVWMLENFLPASK